MREERRLWNFTGSGKPAANFGQYATVGKRVYSKYNCLTLLANSSMAKA